MQNSKKIKYVPDLTGFSVMCEQNYLRLCKLLPDSLVLDQCFEIVTTRAELTFIIRVTEIFRYTSTLHIYLQSPNLPEYLCPTMEIRLYHDANMAEVLSSQNMQRIRERYDYPNVRMMHPDEKFQVNSFLKEWLLLCFSFGTHLKELSIDSQ